MRRFRSDLLGYRRLFTIGAVFVALLSIVIVAFRLPPTWQTVPVVAALLLIILLLNPVEEIHTDVRYLRTVKETSAPSKTYPTQQELYGGLGRAVSNAASTLDLTHIRDQPPAAFGAEAGEYSSMITDWLRQDNDHSVRRIISVRSPEMLAWAKELAKLQKDLPHYHIRVVDWSISAPALNMAIVDQKAVFLALTGDTFERTRGFAIEDKTSAEYFGHYYSVLWGAAVDLQEFLVKQLSG